MTSHDRTDPAAEWADNAPAWTRLTRAGHDRYRDLVNTPAFFSMLPPIDGLRCLDVGCGEGHNTRLVRRAGGRVVALDVVEAFARAAADRAPAIPVTLGDGRQLPFRSSSFDVVTAFMSLMDLTDPAAALHEIARVLRTGGFTQFSIGHPLTTAPVREWHTDDDGTRVALVTADYFREGPVTEQWMFGTAPSDDRARPFTITRAHRTLSTWVTAVLDAGLDVSGIAEPFADEATASEHPAVADTRIAPYFLILRAHKR